MTASELFPDLGPDRPYYVLMMGEGEDAHIHYWTSNDGETLLFVFSSPEEAKRFLNRRVDGNQAYLDFLEDWGPELPESVRNEKWTVGTVTSVDTIAALAAGIDANVLILDAGQDPPLLEYRLPK